MADFQINGVSVNDVKVNGTDVQEVQVNGATIWTRRPPFTRTHTITVGRYTFAGVGAVGAFAFAGGAYTPGTINHATSSSPSVMYGVQGLNTTGQNQHFSCDVSVGSYIIVTFGDDGSTWRLNSYGTLNNTYWHSNPTAWYNKWNSYTTGETVELNIQAYA